jgi:hypothetical protein
MGLRLLRLLLRELLLHGHPGEWCERCSPDGHPNGPGAQIHLHGREVRLGRNLRL